MGSTDSLPQRALVTGGSGFIGTNLVERLRSAGLTCASLDSLPPRKQDHRSIWIEADVRDREALTSAIGQLRPTHLFHLGARTDMAGASVRDYDANTEGVASVLEVLEALEAPPRTLFASTRLVTPVGYSPRDEFDICPDTPYGESKAVGEEMVRSSGLAEWTILRPTSIWGPWFGPPYRQFFDSVLKRRYMHPRGLRVAKTFGFVDNSVDQLLAIAVAPREEIDHRTFYIGDPAIEVGAFADKIADAAGVRRPVRAPIPMLRLAARAGDLGSRLGLFGEAPLTSTRLSNICTDMVFDLSATTRLAGPPRTGVDEAIERTLAWIGSQ